MGRIYKSILTNKLTTIINSNYNRVVIIIGSLQCLHLISIIILMQNIEKTNTIALCVCVRARVCVLGEGSFYLYHYIFVLGQKDYFKLRFTNGNSLFYKRRIIKFLFILNKIKANGTRLYEYTYSLYFLLRYVGTVLTVSRTRAPPTHTEKFVLAVSRK